MARWTGLLSNFLIICLPCSGMESGADQGMRWKRPSLPWLAAPTAGARLANAFLGQRHTLRGGGVQGGIGDDGSSGKDFAPVQEGPAMPSSSEEVEEDWYTREKKVHSRSPTSAKTCAGKIHSCRETCSAAKHERSPSWQKMRRAHRNPNLSQQGSSTGWEKLKAYYEGVEQSIGQNEVDNIGIEEYGPHTVRLPIHLATSPMAPLLPFCGNENVSRTRPAQVGPDAGKDWRGRGAFKWYTVPWVERPLIGGLQRLLMCFYPPTRPTFWCSCAQAPAHADH